MLEDLGYARVVPEEGGKKIYEITDQGRQHLAEHSGTVNDIFERIARFVEGLTDTPMTELNMAFQRVARTTYKTATSHIREKEVVEKIRDILRRTADEIEAISQVVSRRDCRNGAVWTPGCDALDWIMGRGSPPRPIFAYDRSVVAGDTRK